MDALHAADDEWWLCTDASAAADLAAGLNRFKIRVKVDIASVAFDAIALRGEGSRATAAGAVEGLSDVVVFDAAWAAGEDAVDIVGSRDAIDAVRASLHRVGIAVGGADEYEAARIRAGVPRLGVDIDDTTIPQEAFLDERAVSFTKGCFVGQELVCRIDTRGHVNRFLRRVHTEGATPPVGAEVVAGEKVVGAITSVAGSDALAMVRREVEPPAELVVRWADEHATAAVTAI
jgi:folate-binding protein YgfZ